MKGMSWLTKNRLASQEGLCTFEQVSIIIFQKNTINFSLHISLAQTSL